MKNRPIAARVAFSCLVVMFLASASEARTTTEKEVAMKELPDAVRTAAEKAIAGGALKRVVVEKDGTLVTYNVEATVGGTLKEFTFAKDGTLVAETQGVAFAKLPEAVRAAAEEYFGGSRDLRASIEAGKRVTSYAVTGRKGEKQVSVRFNAQGDQLGEPAAHD